MLSQRGNSKQFKYLGEIKQTNFVKILPSGLQVHRPHPSTTIYNVKIKVSEDFSMLQLAS
jgi:hypothetical protein